MRRKFSKLSGKDNFINTHLCMCTNWRCTCFGHFAESLDPLCCLRSLRQSDMRNVEDSCYHHKSTTSAMITFQTKEADFLRCRFSVTVCRISVSLLWRKVLFWDKLLSSVGVNKCRIVRSLFDAIWGLLWKNCTFFNTAFSRNFFF